jgi:hypothetical protein
MRILLPAKLREQLFMGLEIVLPESYGSFN